ncbi:MAG: hypothetical protein LBJ48_07180 [Coriobacteriales bacterium]|nr:hypothetical protein [Coriobacteriales bacterium]
MTNKQAFYAMYYLLDKYYFNYGLGGERRSFDLGSFISNMDPHIRYNGEPMDLAYRDDWEELLEKLDAGEDVSREKLLEAIRIFCKHYVDTYDFDLGEAPARLQSITADDPDLEEAVAKAKAEVEHW